MKQNLLKLLLAAAVLTALFALALPALAATNHTHSYKLVTTRKEPTCTTSGTGLYRCECGNQEMRELPALGHKWGSWKTTKAATCTKAGTQQRTCTRCGEKQTKSIAATGHSYEWKVTKRATCGTAGSRQQVCKVCGAKGKTGTIKATGLHTYEWKVTKQATCGEAGSRQQVCKVCGAKGKTETIKATGKHTYEWKVTKKATCGEAGSRQQVCKVCGQKGKTEKIAATGKHTFGAWTVSKAAACEEAGQEKRACSVCGKAETRAVDPLGHDWGEGAVTREPGFLEPGERTCTCARCGETKTEEIPVNAPEDGSVMDYFRGNTGFSLMNNDLPLMIMQQPVGGSIDRDGGSITLSVEATGGTPPYTYQWKKLTASGWLKAVWKEVKNSSENTLEVTDGYRFYYCTVYDKAGNHEDSDKVLVDWNLYISQQPENTSTCEMDPVILTCKASGGTRFTDAPDIYYYTWFDSEGNTVGYGSEFEVPRGGEYNQPIPDEYHCVVEDAAGNTVTSKAAIVYDADPFEARTDTPVVELADGQNGAVWAIVYGGIEPYTVSWQLNGEDIPTQLSEENEYWAKVTGDGSKEVVYTLVAIDAMEDTAYCTVKVRTPQLKIAQQPQGGMLSAIDKTPVEINVVMAEGTEPFTYYLYCDGEPKEFGEATGMSGGFKVYEPGNYSIHVEDAEGRWADSDVAVVTNVHFDGLTILEQPQNVIAEYDENRPSPYGAFTCKAVAGDGSQDVDYQWQSKSPAKGEWVNRWKGDKLMGTWPNGTVVRCVVTDPRTGEQVISNEAIVSISLHGEITYVGGYAGKSEFTEIAYIITGGKAPYTVKIFADRILGGPRLNPNRTSYMVKYTTVSDNLEHSCLVTGGRNYEVYYESMITGETYVQGEYLEFYLEITDANNNTFTSAKKR